jgi:hypothetical protein
VRIKRISWRNAGLIGGDPSPSLSTRHSVTRHCAHPQSVGEHGFYGVWEELSCLGHFLPILQMSLQHSDPLTVVRQAVFGQRALAFQYKAVPPSLLCHSLEHTPTQELNEMEPRLKGISTG